MGNKYVKHVRAGVLTWDVYCIVRLARHFMAGRKGMDAVRGPENQSEIESLYFIFPLQNFFPPIFYFRAISRSFLNAWRPARRIIDALHPSQSRLFSTLPSNHDLIFFGFLCFRVTSPSMGYTFCWALYCRIHANCVRQEVFSILINTYRRKFSIDKERNYFT